MLIPVGNPVNAVSERAKEGTYSIQVNEQDTSIEAYLMVPLVPLAQELGFSVTEKDGSFRVDNGKVHTDVVIGRDRYDKEIKEEIDGNMVTMKGNGPKYQLALWNEEGFSYSLYLSVGIEKEELLHMVQELR